LRIAIGQAGRPASQSFSGGPETRFTVTQDGELFLGIDDFWPPDNQGELQVEVELQDSPL